jgi:hypothetical protein
LCGISRNNCGIVTANSLLEKGRAVHSQFAFGTWAGVAFEALFVENGANFFLIVERGR